MGGAHPRTCPAKLRTAEVRKVGGQELQHCVCSARRSGTSEGRLAGKERSRRPGRTNIDGEQGAFAVSEHKDRACLAIDGDGEKFQAWGLANWRLNAGSRASGLDSEGINGGFGRRQASYRGAEEREDVKRDIWGRTVP